MRRFRYLPSMALVAALGVANGGCILIPDIQDRIVELAVGGSTFTIAGYYSSLGAFTSALPRRFPIHPSATRSACRWRSGRDKDQASALAPDT